MRLTDYQRISGMHRTQGFHPALLAGRSHPTGGKCRVRVGSMVQCVSSEGLVMAWLRALGSAKLIDCSLNEIRKIRPKRGKCQRLE